MRLIALLIFAGLFMVLPVYLFDSFVMPELMTLQNVYSEAGATAEQVVAAK